MKKSPSVAFSLNAKLNFKVIIVGNKNVGKTSLILRYIKNQFDFNYKVTIGVEFYSKIIQHNEDEVALQIWDTVFLLSRRVATKTTSPSSAHSTTSPTASSSSTTTPATCARSSTTGYTKSMSM